MKALTLLGLLLAVGAVSRAQVPDPRDSIIIESKTLPPNLNGDPAFTIQVSITNKDSLTYLTLALKEATIVGTAFALLVRGPGSTGRTFTNCVIPLTNTLRYFSAFSTTGNNDASPERFLIAAGFDPANPATIEPPNSVRKPVWELKFKHTSDSLGQIIFDTTTFAGLQNTFTDTGPRDMPVNYLPGIITLEYFLKGDLDMNTRLAPADVVLGLNAVMLNIPPPRGFEACDMNCDGERTIADVMLLINAVFLAEGFPC